MFFVVNVLTTDVEGDESLLVDLQLVVGRLALVRNAVVRGLEREHQRVPRDDATVLGRDVLRLL